MFSLDYHNLHVGLVCYVMYSNYLACLSQSVKFLWFNTSLALSLSVLGLTIYCCVPDPRELPPSELSFVHIGFASFTQSVSLFSCWMLTYGQELCYSVIVILHALSVFGCNHTQLVLASLVSTSTIWSSIVLERVQHYYWLDIKHIGDNFNRSFLDIDITLNPHKHRQPTSYVRFIESMYEKGCN